MRSCARRVVMNWFLGGRSLMPLLINMVFVFLKKDLVVSYVILVVEMSEVGFGKHFELFVLLF